MIIRPKRRYSCQIGFCIKMYYGGRAALDFIALSCVLSRVLAASWSRPGRVLVASWSRPVVSWVTSWADSWVASWAASWVILWCFCIKMYYLGGRGVWLGLGLWLWFWFGFGFGFGFGSLVTENHPKTVIQRASMQLTEASRKTTQASRKPKKNNYFLWKIIILIGVNSLFC